MKKLRFGIFLALMSVADPALATGGMECSTAGADPIRVSLGMGHGVGASIFRSELTVSGREIGVSVGQSWLYWDEFRLLLLSPQGEREELLISARFNESTGTYDGSLWRAGRRRWVRCYAD